MENFRCVKGFEGRYWISDLGRVFDCEDKRFLKQFLRGSGSRYYSVFINKKAYYIHRLIAQAFIENSLNKECVDHIDGDRLNNNLDNLRWVTRSENSHNQRRAKGYSFDKIAKKWKAVITFNNKKKHIGYYDTKAEARLAYLDAKKIYHPSSPIV